MIPDSFIKLRFEIISTLMLAAGVPVAMLKTSESSVYEAGYRVFIFNTMEPIARLIEATLSERLGHRNPACHWTLWQLRLSKYEPRSVRQLVDSAGCRSGASDCKLWE